MNGKNITISAGMAFARNMEQDILICIKMQILHYIRQNRMAEMGIIFTKKKKDKGGRKRLCLLE